MPRAFPHRGERCTLRTMLTDYALRDSPGLGFRMPDGKTEYVQTAHLSDDALLKLPLKAGEDATWGDTEWVFIRETNEWIPLFVCVTPNIMDYLTLVTDQYNDNCYYPTTAVPDYANPLHE